MKKDKCRKCGKYTYVEEHHPLPKNMFKGEGGTIPLCPNCHTEYHQKLGFKNLKNPSMEFHFEKFYRWLMGLAIAGAIFLLFA